MSLNSELLRTGGLFDDVEDHTRPWLTDELVHEKYCYEATSEGIEEVYFPGGAVGRVDSYRKDSPFFTAQVGSVALQMRRPRLLRNTENDG